MSFVTTLVASDEKNLPVTIDHVMRVHELLQKGNIQFSCAPIWLDQDKAVDLAVIEKPGPEMMMAIREYCAESRIDVFFLPVEKRQKKMLVADMDSTIVHGETLDEVAVFADMEEQVAEITEAAMQGKMDFHTALRERVSMLSGLSQDVLHKTLEAIKLNQGARCFVQTMSKNGAICVLLSGGFTFFTNAVALQVGFHFDHGNVLDIEDGKLKGTVREPILDKYAKVDYLNRHSQEESIKIEDVLAIGDGANDILMLQRAGLGIGYHCKDVVKKAVDNWIVYGDLTAALYAQGYSRAHFYKLENAA